MQKKQVKIYGFQSNSDKIRMYYETNGVKSMYIVEINRKRKLITNNEWKAKCQITSLIYDNIMQNKINL